MSWSLNNLGESDRAAIARQCFTVKEEKGDELTGLCPFHGETGVNSLSFGYNPVKDACKCFSCGASGDLITLWGQAHGIGDNKEACKRFIAAHGDGSPPAGRGSYSGKKVGGASRNGGQGEISEVTHYIPEERFQALPRLPDNWVKSCGDKFSWSPEVITALDIRLWTSARGDDTRIAIPVRVMDGRLANIRLYRPGSATNKIRSWAKEHGKNKLYPHPGAWTSDVPLLICEGEKDAITALSHGFNAVTQTCGTGSWDDKFTPYFKDLDLVICYDHDDAGRKGGARLAAKLAGTASRVRVLSWPESSPDKFDLTDWFTVQRRTAQDLKDLIALAPAVESPDKKGASDKRGATVSADVMRFFHFNGRGYSFKPRLLVDEILKDKPLCYESTTGKIFAWNGRHWEEHGETHIRNRALRLLAEEATSSRSNDVCCMVRDLSLMPHGRAWNDRHHLLPLQNGLFSLTAQTIEKHDPEHLNTYTLDLAVDLGEILPTCPTWMGFMLSLIPDAATRREIQKFAGYCLTRDTRHEKALMLIGPGGDGKSTFIRLIESILGETNVSNVSLGALSDQFQRVSLRDKLLNVSTEVESGLLQSNMFKALVSGDRITAAFKHKDSFSFRPVAKHIFAANRPPTVQDTTEGYYRRIMYIYVERAFDKPDLFLSDKLADERAGIFFWMVRGLQLLNEEGFTETRYMRDCLGQYKELNNPVIAFCVTHIEPDPKVNTETVTVYDKYRKFCGFRGYLPKSEAQFGKELKGHIKGLEKKRDSARSDSRRRYYVGLRLVDDSPNSEMEKVEHVYAD